MPVVLLPVHRASPLASSDDGSAHLRPSILLSATPEPKYPLQYTSARFPPPKKRDWGGSASSPRLDRDGMKFPFRSWLSPWVNPSSIPTPFPLPVPHSPRSRGGRMRTDTLVVDPRIVKKAGRVSNPLPRPMIGRLRLLLLATAECAVEKTGTDRLGGWGRAASGVLCHPPLL